MRNTRVKILAGDFQVAVEQLFWSKGFKVVQKHPNAIVWTGGADVNPELYKERPHKSTYFNNRKDLEDLAVFSSVGNSFPKIGICRGGQFLNVMAGGRMWQDVDNHNHAHQATDKESGISFTVSSLHHQMMRPDPKAQILLTSRVSSYKDTFGEKVYRRDQDYEDIEALYYPNINAYCHQAHPELGMKAEIDYFFGMIKKHLEIGA